MKISLCTGGGHDALGALGGRLPGISVRQAVLERTGLPRRYVYVRARLQLAPGSRRVRRATRTSPTTVQAGTPASRRPVTWWIGILRTVTSAVTTSCHTTVVGRRRL